MQTLLLIVLSSASITTSISSRGYKRNTASHSEHTPRDGESCQVKPPMIEKEMVSAFLNTLKDPYYSHLIGHTTSSFAELVIVGERVGSPVWSPSRHASFANTSRTVRAIVRSQESTDQKTGIRAERRGS